MAEDATSRVYEEFGGRAAGTPDVSPDLPPEFVRLSESLPPRADRQLGYVGEARFVTFCYDPRADTVAWRDGHTHGLGAGSWCFFLDQIAPLTDLYEVNVGSSMSPGRDVLVIDRADGEAYFAPRDVAERFLGWSASPGAGDHGGGRWDAAGEALGYG